MMRRATSDECAALLREQMRGACHRRPGAGVNRRGGFRGIGGGAASAVASLESLITAKLVAVSVAVPCIFLPRLDTITDAGGGRVSAWANLGTGPDATQGTAGARPLYGATAVGGAPGLTFDGGDVLSTTAVDLSAYSRAFVMQLFVDSNTTLATVSNLGTAVQSNGAITTEINRTAAGRILGRHGTDGTNALTVETADGFPMTTAAVVTVTVDRTLGSQRARIRHAGVDVSTTFGENTPSSNFFSATGTLNIGARAGGSVGMTGAIAPVIVGACTVAFSGAVLTAIADVEDLLLAAMAAGSYA